MDSKKVLRIFLILLFFVMIHSVSVNAATPEDVVFDSAFYNAKYSDLQEAFHGDANQLRQHYFTFGVKEGRQASRLFDVNYYLEKNSDVNNAYHGDKYEAYVHFVNLGIRENRVASRIFDASYYFNTYSDIKDAYKGDRVEASIHFAVFGLKEGRAGSANFDVKHYIANHADINSAFSGDRVQSADHYLRIGYTENRKGKATDHVYGEPTIIEPATCTEEGSGEVKCTVCGFETTQAIEATHNLTIKADESNLVQEIPATCTTAGVRKVQCQNCDKVVIENIKALGHNMGNGVVTTPATCEAKGVKTYTCQNGCGKVDTEEISELGHNFAVKVDKSNIVAGSRTFDSTCKVEGQREIKCQNCAKTIVEKLPINTENHVTLTGNNDVLLTAVNNQMKSYESGNSNLNALLTYMSTNAATYKAPVNNTDAAGNVKSITPGYAKFKCKECDKEISYTLTGNEWYETKAATCYETGIVTCALTNKTQSTPVLEHNFKKDALSDNTLVAPNKVNMANADFIGFRVAGGQLTGTDNGKSLYQLVADSTCDEVGYEACTICGEMRKIAAKGHDYEVTHEATVNKNIDYATYKALVDSLNTAIENDGVAAWATSTSADGTKWALVEEKTCKNDGTHKTYSIVDYKWTVTEPTCTKAGKAVSAVTGKEEVLPKLAHNYIFVETKSATETEQGTFEARCLNGGEVVTNYIKTGENGAPAETFADAVNRIYNVTADSTNSVGLE